MSEDNQETLKRVHLIWDELEELGDSRDWEEDKEGVLKLPVSEGAWLGIDRRPRFHLLLSLASDHESISRRLTSGISITTQEYNIDGEAGNLVDIVCSKRWRYAIEPFVSEVIHAMADGKIALPALRRVVEDHRALWAAPKEPLHPNKQRGVIAELQVLESLGSRVGHAKAISCWTGPYGGKGGGLHDISDETFAVEVKSYHDEPPRVRINHIEQLDHRMDKRLTLVGVHIVSNDEGKSFPEFVDAALEISEVAGRRADMEEKLTLAGWREEDREEYESRFAIGRTAICPIRPETPVFPAHLKDRIPSSVTAISYLLHLNDIRQIPSEEESSWNSLTAEGPWPPIDDNPAPDDLMTAACKETLGTEPSELSQAAESQHLEFKSSTWYSYKDMGEEVSPQQAMKIVQGAVVKSVDGLLNSEGGSLLIGVSDENEVLGLAPDFKARGLKNTDDYELRLVKLLTDTLGRPPVAECVRVSFPVVGGTEICRVDVKPATSPVFTKDEFFFVRINNATNSLPPSEAFEYYLKHWRGISPGR